MRKLILLLSYIFIILLGYGNTPKVQPSSEAKSAFTAKFPGATKIKWSIEKPGEYEVEFRLNGIKTAALFDLRGALIEIEEEIKEVNLPQSVKTSIIKDFSGYKLKEIEKVTHPNGDITYEMEALRRKIKLEISFNFEGTIISKESLKQEK